ncbi:methyltransferase [Xylaria intraflava]|nr:methyltransferase [Xylaria intraflava]
MQSNDSSYRIYTPLFLKLYQLYIIKYSLPVLWKCDPETFLVPLFTENFTTNHLDCGVGNGYFPQSALSRIDKSCDEYSLTLLDVQEASLRSARARIESSAPKVKLRCVRADMRESTPAALAGSQFSSISMFNLLHCVPGGNDKWRIISTYKDLLQDDGVLVGCTLLGPRHASNWFTWLNLKYLNAIGAINNSEDSEIELIRTLHENFSEVEARIVGMVFLFRAGRPRHGTSA